MTAPVRNGNFQTIGCQNLFQVDLFEGIRIGVEREGVKNSLVGWLSSIQRRGYLWVPDIRLRSLTRRYACASRALKAKRRGP